MKKLLSAFLCLLLIISAPTGSFALEADGLSDITGAALYKDGEKLFSYGEAVSRPVGSVSKSFTAALVLRLVSDGLFALDDCAVSLLPDFKMADERYKDITVRMLLNHSSGIYGSTLKNSMLIGCYSSYNHDNILTLLSEQKLKYAPGEMQNYCNDGYSLLELILERVTGEDYSALLKAYITEPLSLDKTLTAKEYSGDCKDTVSALASGGVFSTADELCLFGSALANGKIVPNAALDSMLSESGLNGGDMNFGLGFDDVSAYPFDKYGIKAVFKDGDTLNNSASLLILPELGIAAAVTAEEGSSTQCRVQAIKLVVEYLKNEGICSVEWYDYPLPEKKEGADASECEKYAGFYVSTAGQFRFYISGEYGVLENLYTGAKTKYEYIGNGKFMYRGEVLYFEGDYMKKAGTSYLNNEDRLIVDIYFAQKKEVGEAKVLSESWENRNGKSFFICDEAYNSLLYTQSIPLSNVYFAEGYYSHLGYMKLSDDNAATADLSLPGSYGRDLTDVTFFEKAGKEYLTAQGWTFADSTSISDIYNGEKSYATVGDDGYARWFRVGKAAGKSIFAQPDKEGMMAVYSKNGEFLFSSLLSEGGFTLPEGGFIVFVGEIGAVFDITLN